jgi:hypothetical protein
MVLRTIVAFLDPDHIGILHTCFKGWLVYEDLFKGTFS